ncbi:MAG: hypothetical protein JWQ36_2792 [Enterovirga sp.]|nr:hypothetical protein [Enterovirga sp.]
MGHNDHIDFEFHERIQDLVDKGDLEEGTPAYGVAQQVIHSGFETLTPKQRTLQRRGGACTHPTGRTMAHERDIELGRALA